MKDSIFGTVSTAVGSSGVTLSLFDPDRCILARLHFTFEQWGGVCSMSGYTPADVQLLAPTLEKHLVRLVPAKGELLGWVRPSFVASDWIHVERQTDHAGQLTEEGRFAEVWKRLNSPSNLTLAYLLSRWQSGLKFPTTPSARDHQVAATVIQWLGSGTGQDFLRSLGYEKTGDGHEELCDRTGPTSSL